MCVPLDARLTAFGRHDVGCTDDTILAYALEHFAVLSRPALGRAWLAYGVIALITALRILTLAFDQTDLFVDEAQYWLWGQDLEFGYFSKPPLIAYLLRGVTDLAGQDTTFWIRVSAPILHGITAAILVQIAARLYGAAAAFWTALAYLTLPIVAVGSYMISTDTVAAPFYAAALALYVTSWRKITVARAVAIGALVGMAAMAKYAGLYFYLGLAMAAWVQPAARLGWRKTGLMIGASLCVLAPNLLWNLGNELVTIRHLGQNAGWMTETAPMAGISLVNLGTFLVSQVLAIGPFLAAGLIWLTIRPKQPDDRILLAFALSILALVSAQALVSGAFANWAFPAFLAATPLIVGWLCQWRRSWILIAATALNGVAAIGVVTLYMAPEVITYRDRPVMARHLGRADLSYQILDAADRTRAEAIAVDHRDVVADLLYTGRDNALPVYSARPTGPPRHFFDQMYQPPQNATGPVVWVGTYKPAACVVLEDIPLDVEGGAYARRGLIAALVDASCLPKPDQ